MKAAEPAGERWPYWIVTGTVVLGLLVTAALTLLSHSIYTRNERRLLELRGREVASVIGTAQPTIQTTFASAAAFADATNGDPQQFRRFIGRTSARCPPSSSSRCRFGGFTLPTPNRS